MIPSISTRGSSPRVWGQDSVIDCKRGGRRIIPTRVGTSTLGGMASGYFKDHPHACGDKFIIIISMFIISGSSPRVWGQDQQILYKSYECRIIPTRVGTSVSRLCLTSADKDHPHACGDKLRNYFVNGAFRGSSPRVWGQGQILVIIISPTRIIPTRVGTRTSDVKNADGH